MMYNRQLTNLSSFSREKLQTVSEHTVADHSGSDGRQALPQAKILVQFCSPCIFCS